MMMIMMMMMIMIMMMMMIAIMQMPNQPSQARGHLYLQPPPQRGHLPPRDETARCQCSETIVTTKTCFMK